jgi:hypothetical protein
MDKTSKKEKKSEIAQGLVGLLPQVSISVDVENIHRSLQRWKCEQGSSNTCW